METNDAIFLYKLITGELIIGILDEQLSSNSDDMLYIRHPVLIRQMKDKIQFLKYNQFSKLNLIMLVTKNIVYVDTPDDDIVTHFYSLINPKTIIEDGIEQTVH